MNLVNEAQNIEDAIDEIMSCDWGCGCCAGSTREQVEDEIRNTLEGMVSKLKGFKE